MSIHYIGITQTAPAFLVQVDNDYTMADKTGEIVKPYLTSGRAKLFTYLTGELLSSESFIEGFLLKQYSRFKISTNIIEHEIEHETTV